MSPRSAAVATPRSWLEARQDDAERDIRELREKLIKIDAAARLSDFLTERSSGSGYDAFRGLIGHVHRPDRPNATVRCWQRWTGTVWTRPGSARCWPSGASGCGSTCGTWVCWAAWTGHPHRTLTGHAGSVWAVAVGRAGQREIVASVGGDGMLRVSIGVVDEVIDPARTGRKLVEALASAPAGRGHHSNIPL